MLLLTWMQKFHFVEKEELTEEADESLGNTTSLIPITKLCSAIASMLAKQLTDYRVIMSDLCTARQINR